MGNVDSSNPVRNMDKRTARREYKDDFSSAILNYRQLHLGQQNGQVSRNIVSSSNCNPIQVFIRKRPVFQHELNNGEFDVVTANSDNTITVHDCRMHNDMKRQYINHNSFTFDRVFDETVTNTQVYENTAKQLVDITIRGGYSTCLMYGQTGSGKTFTMTSIIKSAASDIFSRINDTTERFEESPLVSVSYVEVAGERCSDLLNEFSPAQLLTAPDGTVHPFPVVEPTVTTEEELLALIQHGINVRTTAATGVHDASSRSHSILRVYIQSRKKSGEVVEGTMTLVDLAGSEHRIDSMYHGKERRKETSYINASLMALKDCIRARASGNASINHIFRKSKLTLALKASFSLVNAVTYVIATVSPTSKDTEHSLNTLRHACIMHGQESKDSETRFITGGTVETEQIGEIDLTRIARKNNAIKRAGGRIDDPKTSNGNTVDKANAAKQEVELTDKEKARAKRIAEKKSISKMPQVVRDLLKRHRYLLGQEQRQTARMRNVAEVGAIDAYMDSPDHEASEVEEEIGHPLAINKPILEAEEVEEEDLKRTGNSEQNYYSDFHDDHKNSRDDEDSVHSTASLEEAQKTLDKPKFGFEMESPPPRALIIKKRNMQREVVVKQRIPFDQLYDSIYSVADDMPEEMLAKQLARLLSIQGYSDEEIQLLTYEREKSTQKAKPQSSAPVRSPSAVNSRTPASNSAEKVKLRSSSAHRNSRLQHKSISSDDITFAKPNDQIKATPQSSNAESNRSKSRQRSVSMSTSPRAAQSISKLVASRVEESDCIMENRSVREVLMRQDENDGVAKAARELELQALKRQKRREAAKAAKDSQISKNSRNVAKTVDNRDNNHVHSQVESEADYHEREIKRLIYEIQNNTDLSTAALHGIKKTIAKHKAAVLKLIRLEEQKRNEAHEEYEEALPQQSSRPDSHRSKSSREKSRNTISKEHSRYDDDGGFVFETNEKKTPVVVNVDEIPVAAARSRPTSRSVAQPKEAPKVVSPPPAQQIVDNVDDDPIFGKNAQKKKFNPRAAALARYGAKQNVGNAINSEADTSEDNQSDNTKEAHVTGKNDNYDQVDQYQDRLPSARSIPLDDYSDRNNYNDYSHHNQQNIIQNAPKDLYIKANYRQLYLPSNLSNGQQNDFNGRKVRPSQYGAASAPFGNAFTEDRF